MRNYWKRLYFVVYTDGWGGIYIGFLPFDKIPANSKLWSAFRNGNRVLEVKDHGVKGIYRDKDLAEAHMKIERKWRITHGQKFTILEIIPKEK